MDFFRVNDGDLKELIFDMKELKQAFDNKGDRCDVTIGSNNKNVFYDVKSVRKGNVFCTRSSSRFSQDTIVKSNQGIQNISLYFVKRGGGMYSFNERTKNNLYLPSNSSNVFFMQEDLKETSIFKKNVDRETIGIHLSISYFENLVNLYPNLFEESFRRFEKGDSFYINKKFGVITTEMSHILSQVENADLLGNCIEPYVDAKVLELLCLQFKDSILLDTSDIFSKDIEKIREASYVLISDIHNPPSVRNLALKVGVNEKKLKQGFKSFFGTTVYGYLFDYKMELAKQLLLDTKQSILEIALQCGYNYASHFCTAFKRKFRISPLEMRKRTV